MPATRAPEHEATLPPGLDADGTGQNGLLLTGATGFLGMEILARYLERTERRVYTLVRASDQAEATARMRSTIATLFGAADGYAEQVIAVPGDIEAPRLGLDDGQREWLAERVSGIIHSAASVSFTLPLQEARRINVSGTREVLELAALCQRRGGLDHLSHISTSYVAGTHAGEFGEDQLELGQGFRNPYELTKFEAERLVRAQNGRLPVQIFRPSIVVGERTSGWTPSFNVLYSPLKAFERGVLPALPARRSAPVDVVPVDYVADAVFEISNHGDGVGDTYHLVAGSDATTVGRLIDLSASYLDRRPPLVFPPSLYRRIIYPLLARRGVGKLRQGLDRMKVFFPYFSVDVAYNDRRARDRLEPAGIRVSPIEHYFDRLLAYAIRARWGREAMGRAEAQAELADRPEEDLVGV